MLDIDETMDGYLNQADWRVKENANVNFSLGGLILHNSGTITANYWLKNIYPEEVAEAHRNAAFHIHDLSMFSGYCAGWSIRQLISEGLGGVPDKITRITSYNVCYTKLLRMGTQSPWSSRNLRFFRTSSFRRVA